MLKRVRLNLLSGTGISPFSILKIYQVTPAQILNKHEHFIISGLPFHKEVIERQRVVGGDGLGVSSSVGWVRPLSDYVFSNDEFIV